MKNVLVTLTILVFIAASSCTQEGIKIDNDNKSAAADTSSKALTCEHLPSRFANKTNAPDGMVWIPGGEFMMGTDETEAYEPEKPAHPVRVKGFFMDVTEVTNE